MQILLNHFAARLNGDTTSHHVRAAGLEDAIYHQDVDVLQRLVDPIKERLADLCVRTVTLTAAHQVFMRWHTVDFCTAITCGDAPWTRECDDLECIEYAVEKDPEAYTEYKPLVVHANALHWAAISRCSGSISAILRSATRAQSVQLAATLLPAQGMDGSIC
jgi:hypothetical protein